jgi:hypothetical protein
MKPRLFYRSTIQFIAAILIATLALASLPAPIAKAASDTYATAGTFTWTAPAGVTSVTVEVWGGGGRGGSIPGGDGEKEGGGGGGGGYSIKTGIAVTPGVDYDVVVGAGSNSSSAGGDSFFINDTTVLAKGGSSTDYNNGAAGGAADSGVGDYTYSGGNGADGSDYFNMGGGGGSSAGTAGNGTNATDKSGAIAPTGGGNGGKGWWTCTSGNGSPGTAPGGGGGGAVRVRGSSSYFGGEGAPGKVVITYVTSTTVGDGTAPASKLVKGSDINKAVSTFTLTMSTGTDTVTGLVVTGSGTGLANVAADGVKLWLDGGSIPNEWDAGDTAVGSGVSFSGSTATFTGLSLPVTTATTHYLITYDIIASPTDGQTMLAAVTAVTATNIFVNNDSTDATLTVDSVAPTVTINQAATQADPTSFSPIHFTVVFSEVVIDFATGDVTLMGTAGATMAVVTGSGMTYDVAVSGMTQDGTVIARIPHGMAHDAAGNANVASTSTDYTVTYTTSLGIMITRADPNPTNASLVNFTVTFSKPAINVDISDFALTTTGLSSVAIDNFDGWGTTFTVGVSTGTGSGTLRLDVPTTANITGLDGHPPAGLPYSSGEVYNVVHQASFTDVSPTYWAWYWIEKLYANDITGGCLLTPFKYCPENPVTRAEMAVFLEKGMRGSAYIPPAGTGTVFADVPLSYWAADWIEQLFADGITAGCGSGIYCPEAPVTRAQMAIFLLRAEHGLAFTPPAATGVFADVPTTYWDASWIEQLATEGITTGCGGGNYCPEAPVTRAQMAVFLVKTFNLP